jgi:hypothetical protein
MLRTRIVGPWAFGVGVALAMVSGAGGDSGFSEYPGLSAYYCPKYDAVIQFSENGTSKAFGAEYPTFEPGSSDAVANTATELKSCSKSAEMSCVEEALSSEAPRFGFVYAAPKSVGPAEHYNARKWEFTTYRPLSLRASKPTILIIGTLRDGKKLVARYKMYIENKSGVRYLHFDHLSAALYGSNKMDRAYDGVTCVLVTKKGILSDVEVRPEIPHP